MPYTKSKVRKPFDRHEQRTALEKRVGKTDMFTATFVKYGYSNGHHERNILISGVKDSRNKFVARHIWLPLTDDIKAQRLDFGDRFEFEGTTAKYEKGVVTDNLIYEDFTITNPLNAQKIGSVSF